MEKLKRYAVLIFAICLLSINYNLLILPNTVVIGGVSGLGVIMSDLINPSIFIFLLNFLLLVLSSITLGINKTKDFLLGSLLFPIFIFLTADITNFIKYDEIEMLLLVIIGAVVSGFSIGTIIKNGFSTGGVDIVASILAKYFNKSIGQLFFGIDALIISVGAYRFGFIKALYAVVFIYIMTIVIDRIILGISANKAFYIVTNEEKKIKDFILNELGHGASVLPVKGGYQRDNKNMIFCVIPSNEYFRLKSGINEIDKEAFFIITDAYEVHGGA